MGLLIEFGTSLNLFPFDLGYPGPNDMEIPCLGERLAGGFT